jgi:hypothetical protein
MGKTPQEGQGPPRAVEPMMMMMMMIEMHWICYAKYVFLFLALNSRIHFYRLWYNSAPISMGNMFQDLPWLLETTDNTECYT